jgi:hypothetical protein
MIENAPSAENGGLSEPLFEAASWLDQQDSRMPRETPITGPHLDNWLETHVLRQEAATRMQGPGE